MSIRILVLEHAPEGTAVDIFDSLADVVLYKEDIDRSGAVAAADRLRTEVRSTDALLAVTPEYNGTSPAALENAIDWTSRPVHKAARNAGASALDDVRLSVPRAGTRFATIHSAHDGEIAGTMPGILATLAAAVPARQELVQESA